MLSRIILVCHIVSLQKLRRYIKSQGHGIFTVANGLVSVDLLLFCTRLSFVTCFYTNKDKENNIFGF